MAYKFSRGNRGFGDITFEDDQDTGIDFEADTVKLETGGAERLVVENTVITTTVPIHISGSQTEGLRIAKGNADYREIQFETDGVDTAFIQVDSSEGLVIGCQSDNDEIIFMTKAGGESLSEKARITSGGRLGIGANDPSSHLHIKDTGDVVITLEADSDNADENDNAYIEFKQDAANTRGIVGTCGSTDKGPDGTTFTGALANSLLIGTHYATFSGVHYDTPMQLACEGAVQITISDSHVGVGTNSPSHKLDVNGDIRVRGNDIRDNSGNPAISFDGSANTEVVNSLLVGGGVYKKVRDVGSTGNILTTDYMIRGIQSNNPMTLTLPSKSNNSGQILVIKDMLGNAGSPNNKTITIDGNGSDTIDGSSSYVINTNRGSVTLMCDGINGWMVIGKYSG